MSIAAPVLDKSDPRSDKLFPFHVPDTPEWAQAKDLFSQGALMGSGAGMFIRNPLFVWGSLLMSVIAFVNQKPMRADKDAASPLMTLGMGLIGVLSMSIPKMMLSPPQAADAPQVVVPPA